MFSKSKKPSFLEIKKDEFRKSMGGQITADMIEEKISLLEKMLEVSNELIKEVDLLIQDDYRSKIKFQWIDRLQTKKIDIANIKELETVLKMKTKKSPDEYLDDQLKHKYAYEAARILFLDARATDIMLNYIKYLNNLIKDNEYRTFDNFEVIENANKFYSNFEKINPEIIALKSSKEYLTGLKTREALKK